jgi:hypothetical protein
MANYGLQAVRGGRITSSGAGGTVTVTGTGSNSSGFRNVGVCVNDHNFLGDTATISSGGGNVTITGTGGGSDTSYYNYGVWLGAADADGSCRVNPGGTGSLTITGQGGTATGSNNFGVYIGGTDAKVLSAGHITITGIEGGSANGYALNMVASGSVRSTGTGSLVKLIGNSMDMASNTSVTAPDGYVNIYPRTAGVNTDLGSATLNKSGPLTFTGTEFGLIRADTITIGSAASDTITISQNLTVSAGSSVKLSTQATGGIIPSASADFSMAGKTLSFGAGTPLRIAINGITVNTDYNQLSVNGTINLAGTQLSLSDTYTPVDGDVFTIVSATSITGTFNGLADKTVITFNNQKLRIDYTATAVTLTSVVCSNPTDGGTIAGNQTICSGSLPAGLTSTSLPTGHTGDLEFQWQSSTTSATADFSNIQDAVDTTYQPSALTASTWFRRLARVGCMANWEGCDTSNVVKITVTPAAFSISGTARYENNPKTPLNGLKIILKKLESGTWIKVDSAETNNLGFYDFDGLTNATYGLTIKSAHPGGQWQTWNGVNNTDYLIVNQHINGVNLLPVNPPVIRVTASTKELHPLINSQDAIAIRQAAKFPGTGWQYFDIPKWVFSGITADTKLDTIVLACADVTRDIRGLCAGDVNGTYMPLLGYKTAAETLHATSLQVVNQETLPPASEIVFPVRADRDLSLGAITLLLDYDPSRIEITGVEMPGNDGVEPWFDAQNGVLNIGWMSTEGAYVPEGGVVMLIRAKMKITMSNEQLTMSSRGEPIRFSLNESPLSEIADVYGYVLNSIKLSIPDASSKPFVHSSLLIAHCSLTAVYPNPVEDFLNLQFMAETETTVTIGLFNLPGKNVIPSETVNITPGINIKSLDLSKLSNGAYLMKVTMNDHTETRKVIVNR